MPHAVKNMIATGRPLGSYHQHHGYWFLIPFQHSAVMALTQLCVAHVFTPLEMQQSQA